MLTYGTREQQMVVSVHTWELCPGLFHILPPHLESLDNGALCTQRRTTG